MELHKDTPAMAPSFTPKNMKALRAGDQIKVSGTETYATITAVGPTADGRGVTVHFGEKQVTRSQHATVKVLNRQ